MSIGRLEKVSLRELWKHEEHGFSVWLESNIDVLADTLGMSLTMVGREKSVGTFWLDLLAEDSSGSPVIIENQLEATNHDHLGKLLTYLTNLEAKTAIWVASQARPEHIRTISWLNESTPADTSFFLVQLAAYRIGDSAPAPLFTTIVGPSQEGKRIGQEKKDLAEGHVLRLRFWEQLLSLAKAKGVRTHENRTPSKDYWLGAGAGRSSLTYTYLLWDDKAGVDLTIYSPDREVNKHIFDQLYAHREAIDAAFGDGLEWERLDTNIISRIRYSTGAGGLRTDESQWPAIQGAMVDAMGRLSKALKPHIQALQISTEPAAAGA